jgi:hypothetical protein
MPWPKQTDMCTPNITNKWTSSRGKECKCCLCGGHNAITVRYHNNVCRCMCQRQRPLVPTHAKLPCALYPFRTSPGSRVCLTKKGATSEHVHAVDKADIYRNISAPPRLQRRLFDCEPNTIYSIGKELPRQCTEMHCEQCWPNRPRPQPTDPLCVTQVTQPTTTLCPPSVQAYIRKHPRQPFNIWAVTDSTAIRSECPKKQQSCCAIAHRSRQPASRGALPQDGQSEAADGSLAFLAKLVSNKMAPVPPTVNPTYSRTWESRQQRSASKSCSKR